NGTMVFQAGMTFEGSSGDDGFYYPVNTNAGLWADGNDGNDTLKAGANNDHLNGDAGNDVLYGNDGDDTISGGADNDTIYGGAGDNILHGDSGDDLISAGLGDSTIDGGTGFDVASLDYSDRTASVVFALDPDGLQTTVKVGDVTHGSVTNVEAIVITG